MSIFGGSKSSTSVYDQTQTTTLQPVLDNVSGESTVAGNQGPVSVNITDAGISQAALEANQAVSESAISTSADSAYNALAQTDHVLGQALAFGEDLFKTAAGANKESVLGAVSQQNVASAQSQQQWADVIKWVGSAIAAAILLPPLLRWFK